MVCILLASGFEEAEALVPADLLRRAGIQVSLTGLTSREITGAHQITVQADALLDEINPSQVELLVLPGGLGGVEAIQASPDALSLIQQVFQQGGGLAAICAAPVILSGLGLLTGRKAVCYPGMEPQLPGTAVQRGTAVVEDGRFITGEAAGSAFSFGLKLVERLKGPAAAQQVRDAVHYRG